MALSLAPVAAMANVALARHSDEVVNATDAPWAQYQAGTTAYQERQAARRAFDATLPEHVHPAQTPTMMDFDFDRAAFDAAQAQWAAERALYPANSHEMSDQVPDAFLRPSNGAEDVLLAALRHPCWASRAWRRSTEALPERW